MFSRSFFRRPLCFYGRSASPFLFVFPFFCTVFFFSRIYCTVTENTLIKEVSRMKKYSSLVGAGVLCIGFGILLASFLPAVVLVCLEALLLVLAGILALFG